MGDHLGVGSFYFLPPQSPNLKIFCLALLIFCLVSCRLLTYLHVHRLCYCSIHSQQVYIQVHDNEIAVHKLYIEPLKKWGKKNLECVVHTHHANLCGSSDNRTWDQRLSQFQAPPWLSRSGVSLIRLSNHEFAQTAPRRLSACCHN